MNLTKKQIEIIREKTPKALKDKQISIYTTLGYFTPYGANWSYHVGFVPFKGVYVLVVTMFGKVI